MLPKPALAVLLVAAVSTACLGRPLDKTGAAAVAPWPGFAPRSPSVIFHDDMESGENGWTHVDRTASEEPAFHRTAGLAYGGSASWWCGAQDAAYAGGDGYGNGWDGRLDLPEVDLSGAALPLLSFAYHCDSEPGYDKTTVEAEIGGIMVALGGPYEGASGGWISLAGAALSLESCDTPLRARFRFVSDDAFSDEDGLYDSESGAFHVDDIRIYDYYGGLEYFADDAESGGLCTPSSAEGAGDWWHIVERRCSAYSDPSCWWCGSDADTSVVPGGLVNSLTSPAVDISGVSACTLRYLLHAEVPMVDDDFWTEELTTDGGATWYVSGVFWGDFGSCDLWSLRGVSGVDVTPYLPGTSFRVRFTLHTTANGCGPGVAGGAGIFLDDTWLEDWTDTPVEAMSWGRVKALYR